MRIVRFLSVLFFVLGVVQASQAQKTDSLRKAIQIISVDSLNMQDTTNTPTTENVRKEQRRQRKQRPRVIEDSTEVVFKDSARLALEELNRRATMRSVILPGWGQITNGRWWKVPIIYGGFVSVGLAFEFNQRNYRIFLKEAQFRLANPGQFDNPEYGQYNTQSIIQAKDFYRRNRDLSVLIGLGVYAINIIDAYVDSKMFRYDMGDDLTFQIRPSLQTYPLALGQTRQALGLKLAFTIP